MLTDIVSARFSNELSALGRASLYKHERQIESHQGAEVRLVGHDEPLINLCANNYLGLSGDPEVIEIAKRALDRYGYGTSSVRFICGTQDIHKELERQLSDYLGREDTILYSSCFDANTGLFETILTEEDAIISDALNHASIIDGIRLCKARRYRYRNNDLADLEAQLLAAEAAGARTKAIVTDGVFSMDGSIADLAGICDLAEAHQALVIVDDSHALGVFGATGAGTPEHYGLGTRVDLVTGTLGKAFGGASGGFVSGPKVLIDVLRQRSRPYLFSNSIAPVRRQSFSERTGCFVMEALVRCMF